MKISELVEKLEDIREKLGNDADVLWDAGTDQYEIDQMRIRYDNSRHRFMVLVTE